MKKFMLLMLIVASASIAVSQTVLKKELDPFTFRSKMMAAPASVTSFDSVRVYLAGMTREDSLYISNFSRYISGIAIDGFNGSHKTASISQTGSYGLTISKVDPGLGHPSFNTFIIQNSDASGNSLLGLELYGARAYILNQSYTYATFDTMFAKFYAQGILKGTIDSNGFTTPGYVSATSILAQNNSISGNIYTIDLAESRTIPNTAQMVFYRYAIGGPDTLTLPSASIMTGRMVIVKLTHIDGVGYQIRVRPVLGEKLENITNFACPIVDDDMKNSTACFISDGIGWFVLADYRYH